MSPFAFSLIYSSIIVLGLIGTVISASRIECDRQRENAIICGVIFSIVWPISIVVGLFLGLVDVLTLLADLLYSETKS